ncbi:PREDICTED: uncharacterized protein LOC106898887 [Calidris pugnax]|uniref:uncharacterized protein LOC106898887 n=1 Tax=Calidris pugnax TaxID=198806 RepID=UPI00071C3AD1|nr:PREDICTED: uncharacterized protein LOC106898887 [Calidris pugnax]
MATEPETEKRSVQERKKRFEGQRSSFPPPQVSSRGRREMSPRTGSTQVVEQPLKQQGGADSLGQVQEHWSQQSKGEGDRERLVIEPETEKRSIQERKKRFEGQRSSFPPPQVSSRGRREMSPRTGSTQVVEQPLQQGRGADSLGRVQEHRSQQSKGEGEQETLLPELETEKRSFQELKKFFEGQSPMHGGEHSLQQGRGADSFGRVQEHWSQQNKGEGDQERLVIGRTVEANIKGALESFREKDLQQISEKMQALQTVLQNMQGSTEQHLEILRADMENQLGRTVEANIKGALESFREKDLQQISEKMQALQTVLQNMQGSREQHVEILRADMENQLGRTVQTNIKRALNSFREKDLQRISQQVQALRTGLQDNQRSPEQHLEILRADMENQLGRTVEANITRALESFREKYLQQISQQVQALQTDLQNMQGSTEQHLEILRTDMENQLGRTVETSTQRGPDSFREKELQDISEKVQALQTVLQNMQGSTEQHLEILRTDMENQLGRMVEANTARALDSFREKDLQQFYQQMEMLQTAFQNMPRLTQQDLENLKANMGNQFGRMTEASTARAPDSFREKDLQQISQQIQTQETAVQNMQGSTEEHLDILRADMERQLGEHSHCQEDLHLTSTLLRENTVSLVSSVSCFLVHRRVSCLANAPIACFFLFPTELFKMQRYKEDVSLDPDTAHPRLEISDNGKSVKDTGTIRTVPRNEKRFDSHLYVLAKEGYTSGRHYWEVDVGKRSSWALGIARESVTRKGTLTLSPKNGFWVMGCTDGREYWAFTEPWTRLSVGGKLPKIGIFLDISAKQLLFYNVRKKAALYTFTIADGSSREGKLLPFFSTGSAAAKADTEPLKIVQRFDDDE